MFLFWKKRWSVLPPVLLTLFVLLFGGAPAAAELTVVAGNMTLQFDTTIPGNVLLSGGTVNLNGFRLIVGGSFYQSGGTINISGGSLDVGGDYRIQSLPFARDADFGESGGVLMMTNDNDRVTVRGDFVTRSWVDHRNRLTRGVLEVGGDFRQKNGSAFNFAAGGSHRVILPGSGEQRVSFESPVNSGFALFSAPSGNTVFTTALRGWKLDEDLVVNLPEGVLLHRGFSGTMDLGGKTVTVKGNLFSEYPGTINISGGRLIVAGDFVQPHGTVNVGGGSLEVAGDYRLQSVPRLYGATLEAESAGALVMTNDADSVIVGGGFVVQSGADHRNRLTRGILEIKGDFSQKKGSPFGFAASGNHRVVLSGEGQQTVSFDDPVNSGFARCSVSNENVVFRTALKGWTLEEDAVMNVSGEEKRHKGFTGTMNLSGRSLTIRGSLVPEYAGTIALNGGMLLVEGDFVKSQGTMNISGGFLEVLGDYRIEGRALLGGEVHPFDGGGVLTMTNDDDFVLVRGDFSTRSGTDHRNRLTKGVLAVGGNLIQRNGSRFAFAASGTHKTLLFGHGRDVLFESAPSSQFQTFILLDAREDETARAQQYPARNRHAASLKPFSPTLMPGKSVDLSGWIIRSGESLIWASRDQEIASVSPEGKVEALAPGRTAIKVARSDDANIFFYTPIEVSGEGGVPRDAEENPSTGDPEEDLLDGFPALPPLPPIEDPARRP